MAAQFTQADIDQFNNGTNEWCRHRTNRLIYTDGVRFLCEHGAAWLIDAIASYQGSKALDTEALRDFQLWELTVQQLKPGNPFKPDAVLVCRADSDRDPVITQNIEFTDFPLPYIKLYVERGDGTLCLMLPSER